MNYNEIKRYATDHKVSVIKPNKDEIIVVGYDEIRVGRIVELCIKWLPVDPFYQRENRGRKIKIRFQIRHLEER